jgi:hypothetical protein
VESSNARRVFGVENAIVKKGFALTVFITFTRSIVKNALEKNARFMNGWRGGGEWLGSMCRIWGARVGN